MTKAALFIEISLLLRFLLRDAMLARYMPYPSVRMSVCHKSMFC